MTTAAIQVTALVATPETSSQGTATSSLETGETFKKVLNEQTAKAVEGIEADNRDALSKSTKRNRMTSSSAPSASLAPVSSLEAASVSSLRSSTDASRQSVPVDTKDAKEPTSAPVGSTDESARSWHIPAPTLEVASVEIHTPVDTDVSSSAGSRPSDISFASTELSTSASLSEQAATAALDGDVAGAKTSAPSNGDVESSPSITVTVSTTLAAVIPSSLNVESSVARTAPTSVADPTTSRGGSSRGGPGNAVSAAAPSDARRTASVSVSADRAIDEPVVVPTVATNARVTSVVPNVSTASAAEASQLDVNDLASSISQATLGADGSYTINVAMHPSDLGHMQAVVSLNGVDLHVAITPQTSTGHAALTNVVESLKSELSRSGLNVNVSLRDPESRSGRGNEEPSRPSPVEADLTSVEIASTPVSESLNVSQIHLIL
jgi:trimeric autotransporter adhesin